MARHSSSRFAIPLPVEDILVRTGAELRLARVRRKISIRNMAERMMVSPRTVARLEAGDPSISLGILLSALWMLQLHHRFSGIADPDADTVGKAMHIEQLPRRIRSKPRP